MAIVTDVNNNSTSNIDNDVVPTNSLGLDTIGMDGSSGHSCCKKECVCFIFNGYYYPVGSGDTVATNVCCILSL